MNRLTATTLPCDYSNAYLVDQERGELVAVATNITEPPARAQILAVRRTLSDRVVAELMHGRTVLINDPNDEPWFRRVEVESQVGVGTTFRVRVPIALEPAPPDQPEPPEKRSRRGPVVPQPAAAAARPTDSRTP